MIDMENIEAAEKLKLSVENLNSVLELSWLFGDHGVQDYRYKEMKNKFYKNITHHIKQIIHSFCNLSWFSIKILVNFSLCTIDCENVWIEWVCVRWGLEGGVGNFE